MEPDATEATPPSGPPEAPFDGLARAIIEAMSEGVVVRANDGKLLAANASAERILGLTRAQLDGREPVPAGWRTVFAKTGEGGAHAGDEVRRSSQPVVGRIGVVHAPDGRRT